MTHNAMIYIHVDHRQFDSMLCVPAEGRDHAVLQEILNEPSVNVSAKDEQKGFHLSKRNILLVSITSYGCA